MTHIHELRKGKQRVMDLKPPVEEEKKQEKPTVALIDRTYNVPTWKKDFTHVQTVLGKRF